MTRSDLSAQDEARFWKRVDASGGEIACWPWRGSYVGVKERPYGRLRIDGRSIKAHRIAYVIAHGQIDPDLDAMHECDNSLCCNPAHIAQGTRKQNMEHCVAVKRQVFGERHGRAKITAVQVECIRGSQQLQSEIAIQYGITQSAVSRIKNFNRWSSP